MPFLFVLWWCFRLGQFTYTFWSAVQKSALPLCLLYKSVLCLLREAWLESAESLHLDNVLLHLDIRPYMCVTLKSCHCFVKTC